MTLIQCTLKIGGTATTKPIYINPAQVCVVYQDMNSDTVINFPNDDTIYVIETVAQVVAALEKA